MSPTPPARLSREKLEAMLDAARAFPHVAEDWAEVDHEHKIKKIVYSDRRNFDLRFNLGMVKRQLLAKRTTWMHEKSLLRRLQMAYYLLTHVETNEPDATVYGGAIIAFWAEHADYLAEMKPQDVEAALRELAELRAFKEEVGYLTMALQEADGRGAVGKKEAAKKLLEIFDRFSSAGDWLTDPSLTRAERLEKFDELSPQATTAPAGSEPAAD